MIDQEEAKIQHGQKLKRITVWSLGSGGTITALAAVILLLLVITPMRDLSSNYVAQVEVGQLRGDNAYVDDLTRALSLMTADCGTTAQHRLAPNPPSLPMRNTPTPSQVGTRRLER